MPSANFGWVANGNITPSRFVKVDTSAEGRVIQCTATTDFPIGVSQAGTRRAPYSSLNDGFAAIAGEGVRVFQLGEVCPIEAGAAITRGDRLSPDTSGRGITAGAAVKSGGIALESASGAGVLIDMIVLPDTPGAT